jgi:hypothetical protein
MSVARKILREKEAKGDLIPYVRESGFVVYTTPTEIHKREGGVPIMISDALEEVASSVSAEPVITEEMELALIAAGTPGAVKPSKLARKRREAGEKKARKDTRPEVIVEPLEGVPIRGPEVAFEPPKTVIEKPESPKPEPPKTEAPKKTATKKEEKPKKEAPKKAAAKKTTAKKETPKKEASKKSAAKEEEKPKKEAPKKAAAKKTTAKKETSKKESPKKTTAKKETQKKETSKKSAAKKEEKPKKEAPKKKD